MAAFFDDHQLRAANCRRHLFGLVWRCERIAVPNKDARRDGYSGKARTTVDPWDYRLDLSLKSIDANRHGHAHIDFTKGRNFLMLRVQYRARGLR